MIQVFGSRVSYFTGKLEVYLRHRGIAYERLPSYAHMREIVAGTGSNQMPAARLEDGRWMSDTTPMIAWLEDQRSPADGPSLYPDDPLLRFIALLVEDYADEWLWRPAMHYRWSHRLDRQHISGLLADEQGAHRRAPRFAKRRWIARRQLGGFVTGDGVSEATRAHVEQGYLRALELLEATFAERPYVLGERATIADIGLSGPMLRHFGQDPTPEEIMRERAPRVYEWVARMWNEAAPRGGGQLVGEPDAPLRALLVEIAETHLAQLDQNAVAWARDATRHAQTIQGCRYERVPTSRYRVFCLERLRVEWAALDAAAQSRLRSVWPDEAGAALRGDPPARASDYDPDGLAPFNHAINVFGKGVPD